MGASSQDHDSFFKHRIILFYFKKMLPWKLPKIHTNIRIVAPNWSLCSAYPSPSIVSQRNTFKPFSPLKPSLCIISEWAMPPKFLCHFGYYIRTQDSDDSDWSALKTSFLWCSACVFRKYYASCQGSKAMKWSHPDATSMNQDSCSMEDMYKGAVSITHVSVTVNSCLMERTARSTGGTSYLVLESQSASWGRWVHGS